MTKSQQNKINMIKNLAKNLHGEYSKNYEIKQWEIEEYETFISLVVEIGMIGDENTYASIYGRDRIHVFIGKKGGVTMPIYKKNKTIYKPFKYMTYGDNNNLNLY